MIGTADRFYARINAETSALYQLGVPLPPSLAGKPYLTVQVAVDRPHVTVHAVPHALSSASAPKPVSAEDAMRMLLAQGGVAFGVPIVLGTALRKEPTGSRVQLGLDVQVPGTTDGPLTVMFAVIDALGKSVQAGRSTVAQPANHSDYRLSWGVPLPTGTYRFRFVVADAHGNVGSVERGVAAHLNQFGPVATSDLLTSWVAPDRAPQFLALDLLPASATTLRAALELYPDATVDVSRLQVRFRLAQMDDPLHPTITADLVATPTSSGGTLTAIASLPAASIAPGPYTLQATIVNAGQELGTVSSAFRKTATDPGDGATGHDDHVPPFGGTANRGHSR